jgi:RNA polymerase sigma-70 factor (ECF subfamily)
VQVVDAPVPPLPRRARAHAAELVFIERLEPASDHSEDLDTARLVVRIQGGDKDAFADLYMRYFDRVYVYMRTALNDAHEAEDATQQIFIRVLEALPRYERRGQPFRSWLFRIVRNYTVDQMRKTGRVQLADAEEIDRMNEVEDEGESVAAELEWITDRELVMFVERLPLAQRQVLLLRYMLDMSTHEIARVLDRSNDDVRLLQSRALRFLRARLVALGRTPTGREGRVPAFRRFRQVPVLRSRRYALMP